MIEWPGPLRTLCSKKKQKNLVATKLKTVWRTMKSVRLDTVYIIRLIDTKLNFPLLTHSAILIILLKQLLLQ